MKSLFWLIAILSATTMLMALSGTIAVSPAHNKVQLLNNSQTGLNVEYTVGNIGYLQVTMPQGNFTEIGIEGYTSTNRTGLPKLPLLRKIIRVPLQATIVPRITYQTKTTVSLAAMGITNQLLPRQESVAKCDDPASVPFEKDQTFYSGNSWTDEPTVKVEEIGMMRGTRLVALDFTPVQYNPATAQLEIITNANVEVSFINANWAATADMAKRYYSPAFESNLQQSVFNYENPRASLDRYPLGMIIVTPQSYVATLQPFINWKTIQGFTVTVATTEIIGTTTSAIKTYLQNIWNNATTTNPAPSYLLIVGDTPQVPAWTGTTSGGHVTDLNYVRLEGMDFVPEMYFGRFSAVNTNQLLPIVEKTLQYEMFTMPDPSYLSHTVLIAGVDSYYASTHGNGQINYGKNYYFGESTTPNWVPFGPYNIRNHMYLYPASGSADAQILADMSNGLGFINYTAHGSETTWSDPTVTINNINNMTNANKYFVAVGNCCLTNHFDTGECFGEAFIRAPNKGAVAYVGGNNSTYWDEDYYWAVGYKPPITGSGSTYIPNRIGAYDALFHYNNENQVDWANNIGSMVFMGNMAVVASNSSRINMYWEIYSIMGDPSLITYMGLPTPINAQFAPTVPFGVGTLQVNADPYTYVAISKDNVLHGVGLTNSAGALTLNFTPFSTPGNAKLVMTCPLKQPLIADIVITSTSGPYLLVNNMTVSDNNNSLPEAGEEFYLNVQLNNVGTSAAQSVTAVMSSNSQYVTILQNSASVGNVGVSETANVNNIFRVAVSPHIPDQQTVTFSFQISDNSGNNWTATRSITVNAPNISFSIPTFFDPNNDGSFSPGEEITVSFILSNTGHMNTASGTLNFVYNGNSATLSQSVLTLPGINSGINIPLSLQVTIASTAQLGTIIPIGLAYTSGSIISNGTVLLPVGSTAEGFETGVIQSPPWINNSTIPWTVVSGTGNVNSGTYAAKSGTIGNNGMTELSIAKTIGTAGNITFYRRVSSESGYDFLKFYIDGMETGSWSGNQAWALQTYPVTAGQHIFKWTYTKDYSTASGSDCAWLDDIVFPSSGDSNVPIFYLPVTGLDINVPVLNTPVSQNLILRNLGSAALTGTITVPQIVNLFFNGTPVSDTYSYSVPAQSNGIFTISVTLTTSQNINDVIQLTSNDSANPATTVALHIQTTSNTDDNNAPLVTVLEGNYPNPFSNETTFRFTTKEQGKISISIYNAKGQLVKTLVNGNYKAGHHSLTWNGKDDHGNRLSSGLYIYRMQASGVTQTRKMMLMK